MVPTTMPRDNIRLHQPIIYIQSPRANLQEGAAKWRKCPAACTKVSPFGDGVLQLAGWFRYLAKGCCSLQRGFDSWRKCSADLREVFSAWRKCPAGLRHTFSN